MQNELIALGVFFAAALVIFSGLWRRPTVGRVITLVVAIGAAVYLIVALPPSLDTLARPHSHVFAAQSQQMTRSAPIVTATGPSSDSILVVALQETFDVTKSALNQLLRAATADQTRVVSDEAVLQTIVGILLTGLFALSGLIISALRRLFVPAAA